MKKEGDQIIATFPAAAVQKADHFVGLLIVDPATGGALTLDYGLATTRTTAADGSIATLTVDVKGRVVPVGAQAIVLVDTYPVATGAIDGI